MSRNCHSVTSIASRVTSVLQVTPKNVFYRDLKERRKKICFTRRTLKEHSQELFISVRSERIKQRWNAPCLIITHNHNIP